MKQQLNSKPQCDFFIKITYRHACLCFKESNPLFRANQINQIHVNAMK